MNLLIRLKKESMDLPTHTQKIKRYLYTRLKYIL